MILLAAATAGAILLVVFMGLEVRERPEVALILIVGVTILDALLYGNQATVPIGPFRPSFGGQDFRPADGLIATALGARLLVRGLPRRVSAEGLTWAAFMAWYAFAAVIGVIQQQPIDLVLFQSRFVLETGGMIALAAGVPIARFARASLVDRVSLIGGGVGAVAVALAAVGQTFAVPGLPRARFGAIDADSATMFVTVGVITLVVGVCRERPNGFALIGSGVMVIAPFVAGQRAALVGLAVVALIVGGAMTGTTWHRRSPVRAAGLIPVACMVFLPVAVTAVRGATTGEGITSIVLVDRLEETFASAGKQQSADERVGLLREGRRLTQQRPLLGSGLGQAALIIDDYSQSMKAIADFHNIALDLTVRTGFAGFSLFAVALATTSLAAQRRWRQLAIDAHAAIVLGATAAMGGLLAKGMFETIFQKYRLAVLLGFVVGLIAAGASGRSASTAEETDDVRSGASAWA